MILWMRSRRPAWRKALTTWATAAGALAFLADVRPAMPQTPFDLFRERTAMQAAGERCGLFEAPLAGALAAAAAQARTVALRAGYTAEALDRGAAEARAQAGALACDAPRLQQAAERARDAYRAYSGLRRMSFPGEVAAWRADRAMPQQTAAWRLAQDAYAGEDKVVFGVAGLNGAEAVALAVAPADGTEPYAARLIVRDRERLPQPLLQPGRASLAARAPVRSAAQVILAQARGPADPALRPAGARKAVAFRFPAGARSALRQLDPREAISVELLYPSPRGEVVRAAFLEVGDFDAGEAFLKAGAR